MISAVVLAAGTASRLGRTKQLLRLDGKPLVQHVVDAAGAAGVDEIVVVLGHEAEEVASALELPPNARVVLNLDYGSGQSTSLTAGLDAAAQDSEGALVLLADQPGIDPSVLRELVTTFRDAPTPIARVRYRDAPGPALLGRATWDEVRAIRGDVGARDLLERHPEWVTDLPVDGDAPPDIDTLDDYERVRGASPDSRELTR